MKKKVSRRKENIKIKAEINEIETKKKTKQFKKSVYFTSSDWSVQTIHFFFIKF